MSLHSSLSHLPKAYFLLAPELGELDLPTESTSDCSACPMLPKLVDPPAKIAFTAKQRCCTYNPWLYNYLAGRVLRRGGPGAERVRKRLARKEGVNAYAIRPPSSFYTRYRDDTLSRFGQDEQIRCPYWVEEGLHCSVWADRNAVCRTWFCKHDQGRAGSAFWEAFRELVGILQVKLCTWLAELGEPPPLDTASVRDWCRFYLWCADRLDQATISELRALDDGGLHRARELLSAWHRRLSHHEMPSMLGPAVRSLHDADAAHVILEGYSCYNTVTYPRTVFLLFSKMDGTLSWTDALEHTNTELGSEVFAERHIRELYTLGILESRTPEDLIPGARIGGQAASVTMRMDGDGIHLEWNQTGEDPAGTATLEGGE